MSPEHAIPKENWFAPDEYARRLNAVRAELSRGEFDALIVFSPANVYYLTGHHSIDSWEFRAAIIMHDGPPVLLLFQFERGRFLASSWLAEARYYGAGEPIERALVAQVDDLKLGGARLGVESHSMFDDRMLQQVREALPRCELTRLAGLVERVRLPKSEPELACIRRAAQFTNIGMRAATDAAREGVADGHVAAAALDAMLRAGSHHPVMPPTVAAGHRSGISHSEHDGHVLRRGDALFIELSGCWRHYSAPLMRTLTIGPPSDEWREIKRVADDLADVVCATARPGVRAREVAIAARQAMRSIEDRVQFHYNFGYSIGASFPPHWLEESGFHIKESNPRPLEAGMVFHVPLTMRVLGKFAAGTSRTIEIAESGALVLTGGKDDAGG